MNGTEKECCADSVEKDSICRFILISSLVLVKTNTEWRLVKYILVAYGPLQYLHFSTSECDIFTYVSICYPLPDIILSVCFKAYFLFNYDHKIANIIAKIVDINLDFFKSFYSICLKVAPLNLVVLEYIALYPFLLGFITHIDQVVRQKNTSSHCYLNFYIHFYTRM